MAVGSSVLCSVMQSLRAKKRDCTRVSPRSDTNSAKILLTLGGFCLMLHRCFSGGKVFHWKDFCTSAPLFLVLWIAISIYTVFLFFFNQKRCHQWVKGGVSAPQLCSLDTPPGTLCTAWGPQHKKDVNLLEQVQRGVTKWSQNWSTSPMKIGWESWNFSSLEKAARRP